MRISDWSSDVCSSDLALALKRCIVFLSTAASRSSLRAISSQSSACTNKPRASLDKVQIGRIGMIGPIGYRHLKRVSKRMNEGVVPAPGTRSEEHTSELQSLMRISYAVFCLKKQKITYITLITQRNN